jgi:hypothetical protein
MERVHSDHSRIDERSLAMLRLIAAKVQADPDLLDKARENNEIVIVGVRRFTRNPSGFRRSPFNRHCDLRFAGLSPDGGKLCPR